MKDKTLLSHRELSTLIKYGLCVLRLPHDKGTQRFMPESEFQVLAGPDIDRDVANCKVVAFQPVDLPEGGGASEILVVLQSDFADGRDKSELLSGLNDMPAECFSRGISEKS